MTWRADADSTDDGDDSTYRISLPGALAWRGPQLSTATERVGWRVDCGSGTLSRMDEIGFGVEDVAPARRALFELAVEQADQDQDWAVDRDAWLEALWCQLAELLGWDPGPWDAYLPSDVVVT